MTNSKKVIFLILYILLGAIVLCLNKLNINLISIAIIALIMPLILSGIFELKKVFKLNVIVLIVCTSLFIIYMLITKVGGEALYALAYTLGLFITIILFLFLLPAVLFIWIPLIIGLIKKLIKRDDRKITFIKLLLVIFLVSEVMIGCTYINNNNAAISENYLKIYLSELENDLRGIPVPNCYPRYSILKRENVEIFNPKYYIASEISDHWSSVSAVKNRDNPEWVNDPNWRDEVEKFIKGFHSNKLEVFASNNKKLEKYAIGISFNDKDMINGKVYKKIGITSKLKLVKDKKSKVIHGLTTTASYGSQGWWLRFECNATDILKFDPDNVILIIKGNGWTRQEEFTREEIDKVNLSYVQYNN